MKEGLVLISLIEYLRVWLIMYKLYESARVFGAPGHVSMRVSASPVAVVNLDDVVGRIFRFCWLI
jgi:Na+/glutamate symporter